MNRNFITNTPWGFSTVWSVIKGWIDEKTRNQIVITGGDPLPELKKYLSMDIIPDFLGGNNTLPVYADMGPWNDYEIVDGSKKGEIVGIRHRDDPSGRIFTP